METDPPAGSEPIEPSPLPPPPQVSSTLPPPPAAGSATGAGPGPAPGSGPGGAAARSGWYNGPIPIDALAGRESMGAAIGRTAVKAITALVILGVGLIGIPFLFIFMAAAVGAAAGGGGGLENQPTPRTLVAGEAGADINLVSIPISGVILGEGSGSGGGLFGALDQTFGYTVKEELMDLADDEDVDGVILEINSPGGTIYGSKAIADGIEAYQTETGKPVIVFISGLSASGGVYAMVGADEIYADHGTLVGSIGVIFGPFTFYDDVKAIDGGILGGGVSTENGITVEFLTAGRSKDFGNPYREMTDEERAVLQEGLDDAYIEFVDHVSSNRDIPSAEIEKELGALIFGEQQALANGLIDGIANRDDSYQLAADAAGLKEDQTWSVSRIDAGSPGLLGLLGSPLDGSLGEPASESTGDATPRAGTICLGSGTVLAYHGDPSLLCTSG